MATIYQANDYEALVATMPTITVEVTVGSAFRLCMESLKLAAEALALVPEWSTQERPALKRRMRKLVNDIKRSVKTQHRKEE